MSDHAALLRRAAARIRETAQAATEGPWAIWDDLPDHGYVTVGDAQGVLTEERPFTEECNPVAHVYTRDDATHVALWHPGVAFAVAGWLESVADLHEETHPEVRRVMGHGCQWCADEDWPCSDMRHAEAVARTVLGEEPAE